MSVLSAMRLRYEDLRSLPFGSISGAYAGVGTFFVNPPRMLKVTNFTDANLIISFDGVSDKDVIAAQTAEIYDYGSNRADQAGNLEQSAGERVYVKQETSAPTVGTVYVTMMYASEV